MPPRELGQSRVPPGTEIPNVHETRAGRGRNAVHEEAAKVHELEEQEMWHRVTSGKTTFETLPRTEKHH